MGADLDEFKLPGIMGFQSCGKNVFRTFQPRKRTKNVFFANPEKPMIPGRALVKFYSRSKNIAQFVFFLKCFQSVFA
jgi:hypothetical protein